jgi:hypothetical protein
LDFKIPNSFCGKVKKIPLTGIGPGLIRTGCFCLHLHDKLAWDQMWTLHHRAFLACDSTLIYLTVSLLKVKNRPLITIHGSGLIRTGNSCTVRKQHANFLQVWTIHYRTFLTFSSTSMYPTLFWLKNDKNNCTVDRPWLEPDSNRLLLLAVARHYDHEKQTWTIHNRALLPFNWASIYQTVSAVNEKDSAGLNWPRPDSNRLRLLTFQEIQWGADVDHPPPGLFLPRI